MKYHLLLTIVLFAGVLRAQEPVAYTSLNYMNITEADSLFIVSTISSPGGTTESSGIFLTTQPLPFIISSELQTSVLQIKGLEGINVFPNPATTSVNLQRNGNEENLKIELVTLQGNTILKRDWPGIEAINPIQLITLPSGIYFLRIIGEDESRFQVFKILKQ